MNKPRFRLIDIAHCFWASCVTRIPGVNSKAKRSLSAQSSYYSFSVVRSPGLSCCFQTITQPCSSTLPTTQYCPLSFLYVSTRGFCLNTSLFKAHLHKPSVMSSVDEALLNSLSVWCPRKQLSSLLELH